MNKLRLLVTQKCNRACEGCCNKDWDLDNLPKATIGELAQYDEIIFTGGEPMLKPDNLINIATWVRGVNPKTTLYLYTAKVDDWIATLGVLRVLDGVCVTLHEQADVQPWQDLDFHLSFCGWVKEKSLRLNIFKDIVFAPPINTDGWKIKSDIEWIKHCPLPEGETFKRL